ncbi:hypothetical protein CesoFtcFv8_013842 [Champsocephalus esox]|uniref:Uncharacterized protein n=1 Tax=Champsocephalus esox TaxID=159716 RepID=A0AAN8BU77_9TELE|nr:hypothetical protein CesoFtcFv8_013842 [Champsocephalus esox]
MPFVRDSSSKWAGLSEELCRPMAAPGSPCGFSDLRYIIKSAHSFSLWPRWLWGPGPDSQERSGALCGEAAPRGAANTEQQLHTSGSCCNTTAPAHPFMTGST